MNHNRIPSKELLGHDIAVGEQVHVDHLRCPAGSDTRQRLYIKRLGIDAYVGHCFNCGGSGYHFGSTPSRVQDLAGRRYDIPVRSYVIDIAKDTTAELPLHVKAYLRRYALDDTDAEHLGYRYHGKTDSLVMPYYQCRKSLKPSFQQRYMDEDRICRYSTHEEKEYAKCSVVPSKNVTYPRPFVALVEDQISAYRVWRESGGEIHAIALLGTSLSVDVTTILTTLCPNNLLIWMDKDPAGIKACIEIRRTLEPILKDTHIANFGCDQPKDFSVERLKEILDLWMTSHS